MEFNGLRKGDGRKNRKENLGRDEDHRERGTGCKIGRDDWGGVGKNKFGHQENENVWAEKEVVCKKKRKKTMKSFDSLYSSLVHDQKDAMTLVVQMKVRE